MTNEFVTCQADRRHDKQEIVHFDWQEQYVVRVYTEEGGWPFLPNEFFTNHLFRCNMDVMIDTMIAFLFFIFADFPGMLFHEPTRSLLYIVDSLVHCCWLVVVGNLVTITWKDAFGWRNKNHLRKAWQPQGEILYLWSFHLGMSNGHQVIARRVCKEIATSSLNRSVIIKWFPASHSAHLKSPLRFCAGGRHRWEG